MQEPWSTYPPGGKPIWECLASERANQQAREHWEERASIMEFGSNLGRGRAELFAYAFLVERLHFSGVIPLAALTDSNVAVQLDRAKRIRNDMDLSKKLGLQP